MNRKHFYDYLRQRNSGVFGTSLSQAQVEGCEALLTATENLTMTHRAYILATAYHETARTMQPVRETLAKSDDSAIRILDKAYAAGKLGQVKSPYWRRDADGRSWLGRGYVQLTHRANYAKAQGAMGVPLLSDPSLAMRPDIAAMILIRGCQEGWFTGKRLSNYLPGDYVGARRIVNGTDKAMTIAGYAKAFEAALLVMITAPPDDDDAPMSSPPAANKAGVPPVEVRPIATKPVVVAETAIDAQQGFWARLIMALMGIWRGRA